MDLELGRRNEPVLPDHGLVAKASPPLLFGHPRPLFFFLLTEGCWSFAYHGTIAMLSLYLGTWLFIADHAQRTIGAGAYIHSMGVLFGPRSSIALASGIFGLVTSFAYLLPIAGGWLSDRTGKARALILAGLAMTTAGHLLLVSDHSFLVGLVGVAIGAGLVKSNMLAQIGDLYSPADPRRTRAFGLLLVSLNVGGFLAPLVCGTLAELVSWSWGFSATALGSAAGFCAFLAAGRTMPLACDDLQAEADRRTRLTHNDILVIQALLLVFLAVVLNAGVYNQAFNIFPIWAAAHVNREVLGFQFPVTWFISLDGLLTIAAAAAAVRFWAWESARGRTQDDLARVSVGAAMTSLAFLCLTISSMTHSVRAGLAGPLFFFILADSALPWSDTVALALFSRTAPRPVKNMMLGTFYLAYAAGNLLAGLLGQLYATRTPAAFWAIHSAIAAFAFLYVLCIRRLIGGLLRVGGPDR